MKVTEMQTKRQRSISLVKNYSPRLLDIYKFASVSVFTFNCGSEKKARALRHRLHALRRAMRRENHWLTPAAEGVIISQKGNEIIAHPPDNELESELEKALKAQGFKETKI